MIGPDYRRAEWCCVDLGQLEAFHEVVQEGSFRRAARALFLSHPALSERIHRLEREVAQTLFERQGNRVRLTQAGRALVPYVERALEIQRQGRDAVLAMTPAATETLRLGATPTATAFLLPDALAAFRKVSSAELLVTSTRTATVLGMVLKEEVDVGLLRATASRARALVHPDAEIVPLLEEPVVLVTHPLHPFAREQAVSIETVVKEPLVLYRGQSFYSLIEQVCADLRLAPEVHMRLQSVEMAKQIIQRNLGITFLPWTSVRRELAAGSLVRIALEEPVEVMMEVVAVVKRSSPLTAAACAFLNVLLEEAAVLEEQLETKRGGGPVARPLSLSKH